MNGEAEGTDSTDFDSNANLYSLVATTAGVRGNILRSAKSFFTGVNDKKKKTISREIYPT